MIGVDEFMFTVWLLFALVGLVAGLIAGLFGLGGGVVMVPAMIYSFTLLGFDQAVLTHMAVGTSLACIVVTSMIATRTHHQKGAVDWRLLRRWVPGLLIGAWLGGVFAAQLAGPLLQLGLGIFLLLVGLTLLMSLTQDRRSLPGALGGGVVSALIGALSSLFGIGGGSLTVPYLRYCRVPMQRAVATSAAQGFPLALAGSLSFVWQGWGNTLLPEVSSGFVYWPAFIGLVVCSAPATRVGAKLAHRLPAEKLQKGFAVALLLIGVQFFYSYFSFA